MIANHARGRDHRAVAAQDQHQVNFRGKLVALNLRHSTTGLVGNSFALDLRSTDERDIALGKPHHQVADGLQGVRLVRFKDYSYPLN
jgi:hypothetical protein